jgi:hypothetical protein
VFAWLAALLLLAAPAAAQPDACRAADPASLRGCMAALAPGGRVVFTRDITCRSAAECCPGGAAPMRIVGHGGVAIDGQGHSLRRIAGQKACAAVVVRNAPDLTIANLTFDEDKAAAPCELGEKPCAHTLDIGNTRGLVLDRIRVLSGKGYVVRVWNAADVTMRRAEILDAGMIGFYAGHSRFGATTNLTIENSRFVRARTNGVALQGVDGAVLRGNLFHNNHWHGLWPVPGVPGGITPGGQLLLAAGSRMVAEGNTIAGGNCGNCTPSKLVTAIEVGEGAHAPGVRDLTIAGNRICHDGPGMAIYHNPGAPAGPASVTANRFSGYTGVDNLRGPVARAANVIAHGDTCGLAR